MGNNCSLVIALIPALNEEDSIKQVVEKTLNHVDLVVVVDDCSNDKTVEFARRAGARVLSLNERKRVGGVVKSGINYIKKLNPEILIILDGDGQHNPENIPQMLDALKKDDVDWVLGSRYRANIINNHNHIGGWYFRQNKHVHIKGFGNWFFSKLVSILTFVYITDVMSGFKALKGKTLDSLDLKFDYAYCPEMAMNLCYRGYKMKEIPIEVNPRQSGISKVIVNVIAYGFKQLGIVMYTFIRHLLGGI